MMFLTSPLLLALAVLLAGTPALLKFTRHADFSWLTVGVSSLTLLLIAILAGHFVLHRLATEISVDWSPDHQQRVVIYKLPFHSSPGPGSIADSPGFARLYSADNKSLGEVHLRMIQNGQITWFDDFVEIGSTSLRWNGSN